MKSSWLLQEWNPQLWREIKGRWKKRNVLVTIAVSLISQWLWVMLSLHRITDHMTDLNHLYHMTHTWSGWLEWCFSLFHSLTSVALLLMLFVGNYLIVQDIRREARRGTLNSIRLSPVSAESFLMGKLLGVPILLYLAIALVLPLHLWAAFRIGIPVFTLLMVYLSAVLTCACVYTFSLLYALGWGAKAQTWYLVPPVFTLYLLLFCFWQFWGVMVQSSLKYSDRADWFLAPSPPELAMSGLFLLCLVGIQSWFWQTSLHRFHHPPNLTRPPAHRSQA